MHIVYKHLFCSHDFTLRDLTLRYLGVAIRANVDEVFQGIRTARC